MQLEFYKPQQTITGPAYSIGFKVLATIVMIMLAAYALHTATRFPLGQLGFGGKTLLAGAAFMMAISYYWFMKSTITINDEGITQRSMVDRQVDWREIHSAKMFGIPFLNAIFPPRLVVRAGNSFKTFNGGSQAVLVEFAKISRAYQVKK